MKQLIFYSHDLAQVKAFMLTDVSVKAYDCISPQKTTIEIALNKDIANNDIVVIRDQDTLEVEYIGVIDTVAHDLTTSVLMYPFVGIFDRECLLTQLDGSVYSWIVANVTANFIGTGDDLNDFPIVFENAQQTDTQYTSIIDDKNLLDELTYIFINTGVFVEFSLDYGANGKPTAIRCKVRNSQELDYVKIRFDNPIIVDSKVTIERSHASSYNKAIIRVMNADKEVLNTQVLYLREDNKLTTSPTDNERIKQVVPKIIDYIPAEDEVTAEAQAEAIVLLAQKALCGDSFDHSIEFNVIVNPAYKWEIFRRCVFMAFDRIYDTYITKVEQLSDKHLRIVLGAYRYTLTDRFKALRKSPAPLDSIKGLPVDVGLGSNVFYFTQEGGDLYLVYDTGAVGSPTFSLESGDLYVEYDTDIGDYAIDDTGDLVYND